MTAYRSGLPRREYATGDHFSGKVTFLLCDVEIRGTIVATDETPKFKIQFKEITVVPLDRQDDEPIPPEVVTRAQEVFGEAIEKAGGEVVE